MSFAYALATHNLSPQEFFPMVISNLDHNLDAVANFESVGDNYHICFDTVEIVLNRKLCALAQFKGAYSLDSLVLRKLISAGLPLGDRRTPYLEKCIPQHYGIVHSNEKEEIDPEFEATRNKVIAEKIKRYL